MSWDGYDHEEAARAADYWMRTRQAYESAGAGPAGGDGGPPSSVEGLCWCNLGGVGVCSRDGSVFCGEHRRVINQKNFCVECAREIERDRKQDRARRWQQRYDGLPRGGPEQLRAFLTEPDTRGPFGDSSYRYEHLSDGVVEAVVLDVLSRKGATNDEKRDTLASWRGSRYRTAEMFENPGGGGPDDWPLPDPLRLAGLQRPFEDVTHRVSLERRNAEEYQQNKIAYRKHVRKLWALGGAIFFFVVVALVLISAGAARQDFGVAAMAAFTLIPILGCAGGISSLNQNVGKPRNPDKPFLGYPGVGGSRYD